MTEKNPQHYARMDALLAEANHCVACGLCLPHCPTYQLTQSEADSPRGRIALIAGVAEERIPMNARFIQHMDRCLTCRACEAVCPSNVKYGQLIDGARAMIQESDGSVANNDQRPANNQTRHFWERALIMRPYRFDWLRPLLRLWIWSRLPALLPRLQFLQKNTLVQSQRFLSIRHLPGHRWRSRYPAKMPLRGEVALFLGCIARLIDVETLLSTIQVLNQLGYTVHVPRAQTCCGALHQHSGRTAEAVELAQHNVRTFAGLKNIQAIISTASGCGVQLTEYPTQLTESFAVPVIDITAFLAEQDWSNVDLAPLPSKIAVHEPCTLRTAEATYHLLRKIPEAEIVALPGNEQCCGAAGTYFLDQPEFAQSLLTAKVDAFEQTEADYLATANIGCALHIANGLVAAGRKTEVLHPVTLLARQMRIQ